MILVIPVRTRFAEGSVTEIAHKAERATDATTWGLTHCGSPTRRLSQTVLGLGLVGVLGFIPVQKLVPASGVEAVVNARVITLSAPIDGEVQTGPSLPEFGAPFARGDLLLRIINVHALAIWPANSSG
jgi:hypothetical protein